MRIGEAKLKEHTNERTYKRNPHYKNKEKEKKEKIEEKKKLRPHNDEHK